MKKNIYSIGILFLFSGITLYTGCKKDDTTPPVVTLNGSASATSVLNTAYSDPGATASDDEDGDISSSIVVSGTVDKDNAGTYTLTYTATDAAGNVGTATRSVKVSNSADNYAGAYNGVDTAPYPGTAGSSFPVTFTASGTKNNRLIISKFANYINAGVYVDVSGSSVTVPSQTVTCGSPAFAHTFVSSTVNTASGISSTTFTIYYKDSYTDNGPQVFEGQTIYTKQ